MDKITIYSFLILAMTLALPVLSHVLRERPRALKYANYLILIVYLFANLYLTILSRPARIYHHMELTPFWSYIGALDRADLREEILLNVILYIPFGYLMHYAFPKMKWWMVAGAGFLLSGFTETVQLFFKLGLCEVDDLISNTLGTLAGIGLYKGYKKLKN